MAAEPLFIDDKSSGSIGRFVISFGGESLHNRIAAILFTLLLVSPDVWPDTVKLKSGKIVHGIIRERNSRLIQLDAGLGFPITYYLDEIQDVVEDDQGPSDDTSSAPASLKASNEKAGKADQMEQQGLAMIDEGKMDEGLALLRQAIGADPKAIRHFSLGGILFGNGVALSKQGDKDASLKIFREAQEEIQKATAMFDPGEERTLLSQAYYMLGEMHANAFDDKSKAKEFYEKSLSFYANPEAQRALDGLK